MEAIREAQKKYCTGAMTVSILAAVVLILAGQKGIGKGLVLGTLFSVLNFILIGENLPARMGLSKGKSFLFALVSICLRYALLAVPLVLAIQWDEIALVGTIPGIFMVQLTIIADHFYRFIKT
jgi:hypothetical protein